MPSAYQGPLRDEPIAIELSNTCYALGGVAHDGLADDDQRRAWLAELAPRLALEDAPEGACPSLDELAELRHNVRAAFVAAIEQNTLERGVLAAINRVSALDASSAVLDWDTPGRLRRAIDHHGASRSEIVLAAFARASIELLTGPHAVQLRACGAPGCVLLFLKDHPRRGWCCDACGNRARQARHYQRSRSS